ncbi:MAG: polyprenyl diphosphate synthase [Candidatus Komeilibacteria bacterium]
MAETTQIPLHIGIIPDGNRRWAKAKGLPALKGHEAGFKAFQPVAEAAFDAGVKVLSAWGFSTENWHRAAEEVSYLMDFFVRYLNQEAEGLNKKNIKLLISGSRTELSTELVQAIEQAEQLTAGNSRGVINICLNYGGRKELVDAVNQLIKEGKTNISAEDLSQHLYHQLPDLDLIIRTAGERRLSGFMPWQGIYSELYFSDKFWPDFSPADLRLALEDFANRKRTFGGN